MHIPHHFKFEDKAEKIEFMRQYSFATIVTMKDDLPIATQLPFVINEDAGRLVLSSHFGIANEQVKYIEENTSLIIFSEPHAYISPVHYDKAESVPTWDYISVHAYGKAKIIDDEAGKAKALEQMIGYYEQNYLSQWDAFPEKFKSGMMRGIAAFELEVTGLQGQKKISQNKNLQERERIAGHLADSDNSSERTIADYIRKL